MSKHSSIFTASHVTIHGDIRDPRLDQPNVTTINPNFKNKNGWKKVSGTRRKFFEFLCHHQVGLKEGSAFVPGELVGRERSTKGLKSLGVITFDVDSGFPIEEAIDEIKDMELMALIYTTHSSGSTSTQVISDKIVELYGKDYSDQDVLTFLKEVRDYDPSVLEAASVSSKTEHTSKGIMINVSHKPMLKYRIVIVLSEVFNFAERDGTHKAAIAEWKSIYKALGKSLKPKIDISCQDVARMFYFPRHSEGNDFSVNIIIGEPLDIKSVKTEPVKQSNFKKSNTSKTKLSNNSKAYKTLWLKKFATTHAKTFDAEAFFIEYCDERNERSAGNGLHVECPNDSEHGNPGDSEDNAFFVVSPHNNDGNGFFMKCMHDSCGDLDRLDFLDMVIQENELEYDDLLEFCDGNDNMNSSEYGSLPSGCYYANRSIVMPVNKDKTIRLCSEFHFIGKAKNPDGTGHSLIIKTNAGIIVHSLKNLHEDPKRLLCELADKGVTIVNSNKGALNNMLSQVPDMDLQEYILAAQPGYIGDHYVLPSGIVIGDPPDKYMLARLPNTAAWKYGSLDGWKAMANKAWADGNNLMRLALLLSAAAMVSNYLKLDGFVFAATGSSSTGKTTALKLAASFFGNPVGGDESSFVKLKVTDNSMEGTFERLSGALSSCDELSMYQGNIQDLVFMITEGRGKMRANQRGEVRKPKIFHGAAFISSEVGVIEMLTRSGGKPAQGMNVRCFDVDVSNVGPVEDNIFDEIVGGFGANYGHACEIFAEELLNRSQKELLDDINEVAEVIIKDQSSNSDYTTYLKRAVKKFGLLEVAGTIMESCGLIPADKGPEVYEVVDWAWENSVGDPTKNIGNPIELTLDVLRKNLITKKGLEFVDLEGGADSGYKEPMAFYSTKKNNHFPTGVDEVAYIPGNVIEEWSGGTSKIGSLVKELKRLGVLIISSGKNIAHESLPGKGKFRHYRLDLKKFIYIDKAVEE